MLAGTFCVRRPGECAKPVGMTDRRPLHNLALIGFMGVGKSSIGRMVGRRDAFHVSWTPTT